MRALVLLSTTLLFACGPQGPQWEKSETKVTSRILALHGFAANDVWAVGDDGLALHFDGTTWTKVTSGTSKNLHAVWGATSSDVWVTGESGLVLRWNGTSLQTPTGIPANRTFESVRGLNANTVFFCSQQGLYFFDGSFHEFTRGGDAVGCTTLFPHAGGVAALLDQSTGSNSEVQTLTASGGTLVTLSGTLTADSSTSMISTGTSDFWLLRQSASSVLRFGGDMPRELVLPKDMSVNTGFVRSPTDVWLGGSQGRLAHSDGMEATLKVAGDYEAPTIHALWGQSGVMFAAGDDGWVLRLIED